MASGRFRTESLSKHWSENKAGHCKATSCDMIPGTLEHLLIGCPALDTVRQRMYTMWLARTVMFPTLHSTIKNILHANEQTIVQFILEPLAFSEVATSFKIHGQRFIDQLSYLTRTFAFYIDREYRKIVKKLKDTPPHTNIIMIEITNPISVPALSDDLPVPPTSNADAVCYQSDMQQPCMLTLHSPEQLQHSPRTDQPQLCVTQTSNSDTSSELVDMPCKVSKASPISECSTLPSSLPVVTMSDPSSTQACTAVLQQGGGVKIVQKMSLCHVPICHGLGHIDGSGGGGRHHLLDS